MYERSFNRFELKYIIRWNQAEALKSLLLEYMTPDLHAGTDGAYDISSLYLDSPELLCYWEKIEGLKFRRKLRIRTYGNQHSTDSEDSDSAFVEIKQRIDKTVQKRRTLISIAQVRDSGSTINDLIMGSSDSQGDSVIAEAAYLISSCNLVPTVVVSYRRTPLLGVFERGLRVTFDSFLRYDSGHLDFNGHFSGGSYFLPPELIVLEVKFNETVPLWLTKILAAFSLQPRRISKYCSAVAEAFQGISSGSRRVING